MLTFYFNPSVHNKENPISERVSNTFRRLHVCKIFCKIYRLTGNRDVPPCACDSRVLTESLWGTNVKESPEAQMSCMHFTPQLVEHMFILSVRHSSAVLSLCSSCWSQSAHLTETVSVLRMRSFLTASSLNPAEVSLCHVGRWSSSTGGTAPRSRFCLCGD